MKKHSWFVACLAAGVIGLVGQTAASGAPAPIFTNATYTVTAISLFNLSKIHIIQTNSVTVAFATNGVVTLTIGTNDITGTYTETKSAIKLSPNAGGLAVIESNAVDLIDSNPDISDLGATASVKSLKFTPITLKKGAPQKATDTITGTLSAVIKGKERHKGYSLLTEWVHWVPGS
jgi:hypothetical protein